MALLDFITRRNAQPQQPAATPQPQPEPVKSVQNLPDSVKALATETARPAAETMGKGAEPKDPPVNPAPSSTPAKGRSLGWER